jgi:hypothetical protein
MNYPLPNKNSMLEQQTMLQRGMTTEELNEKCRTISLPSSLPHASARHMQNRPWFFLVGILLALCGGNGCLDA